MVGLPNYDNTQKWLTTVKRNKRRIVKIGMAQVFARLIQPFVNTKFAGATNNGSIKGILKINVIGEPLFLPNGSVVFR